MGCRLPATFGLIATLDKQLRVASPDIQPGLEMSRQGGIETEGVLKLEENTSYKIDYTPTLGV